MVSTVGPAPRWAVPVAVPPLPVSAVIALVPAEVSGAAADQVRPSGEVHSTACRSPAGPASPTATNPPLVAVTPVTVAVAHAAPRMTWVSGEPAPAEVTTMGTSIAPALAKPAATKRPPAPAAADCSVAVVAPDGLVRSCSVHCRPSADVQTVWECAVAPTATKPLPTATAAAATEPVLPLFPLPAQSRRLADHQNEAYAPDPVPCLPTTTYPPGPDAAPRNCASVRASAVSAGSGDQVTPSADQKATGWAGPPSIAEPTAIHPASPWATEVRCPVSPPNMVADTRDHVPPAACRQTAGWPFA